jgi:PHD/YefM family antitoxin component YafN of YafNO toxin-antitoxin module
MRTIKAAEFKARCLKLMDEVAASGEPLAITIEILENIIQPIDLEWEAIR